MTPHAPATGPRSRLRPRRRTDAAERDKFLGFTGSGTGFQKVTGNGALGVVLTQRRSRTMLLFRAKGLSHVIVVR
jgi:hypothetical protein